VFFPVCNAASFPLNLSHIFYYSLTPSRLYVILAAGRGAERREFKWTLLRSKIGFPLTVCVSVCHTDASNGEVWGEILPKNSFLANAMYKLYISRSHNFQGEGDSQFA